MDINDAVMVKPYGGSNKHVGIISSITDEAVYCKEWYGINITNLVEDAGFFKDAVVRVPTAAFDKAKKTWEESKKAKEISK